MSDFPNTVKLSAGGVPAEGEFLGFGTVVARDGVRVDHFGLPMLFKVRPELAASLEMSNGQVVVIRYTTREATAAVVSAVWSADALRPLLAPADK